MHRIETAGSVPTDDARARLSRARAARLLGFVALGFVALSLLERGFVVTDSGTSAPLHAVLELFATAGIAAVVIISIGAGRTDSPPSLQLAGAAFLGVAILNAAHLLTWPGFPDVLTPNTPHKTAILRLGARTFATAGLFLLAMAGVARALPRVVRTQAYPAAVLLTGLVLGTALLRPGLVPALALADGTPTPLAIALEAIFIAVHAVMLVQLIAGRAPDRPIHGGLLVLAIGFSALSQLYLMGGHAALHAGELVGHLLKIASVGMLVAGVVVAMIREPYRRLQASERALRQSQKLEAVARLAGGVAHDFNNLLTAILASSELARLDDELTETQREHLEEISGAARRAARLTRELLAFGQPAAPHRRAIDAGAFLQELQPTMARLAGDTVTLDLRAPAGPVLVDADRGLLEQAIVHLVTNAAEAMPHGGVIAIDLAMTEHRHPIDCVGRHLPPGRYAVLAVRDSGHGIPASVQSKVFEPFFTTHAPGQGSGLGLSMVLGILTAHGGGVQLESLEGEGTVVRLFLPLVGVPACVPA